MTSPEVALDPERQHKAREYARIARRLFFVQVGGTAGIALLLGFLARGGLAHVGSWLPWAPWLGAPLYFMVLAAGFGLLWSPLTFYQGHVLPRRFGLSIQGVGSWLADRLKGGLLGLVVGAVMTGVVYWLLVRFPDWWWLMAAGMALALSALLSWLLPTFFLSMFYRLRPLDDTELRRRLLELARRAKLRVRGVSTMNVSTKGTTANAMLTGLGNRRRIVLTDTLLSAYTPDEIEVVLAHEIGHQKGRDIVRLLFVRTAALMVALYLANLALRVAAAWLGLAGASDVATLPILLLVVAVVMAALEPASAAYSRRLECKADWTALRLTRMPAAFITMMTKLTNQNLSEADPPRWVRVLFHDHPSHAERVTMARQFEAPAGSRADGSLPMDGGG